MIPLIILIQFLSVFKYRLGSKIIKLSNNMNKWQQQQKKSLYIVGRL